MKWVPYARQWWKLHSVHGAAAIIAVSVIQASGAAGLSSVLDYRVTLGIIVVLAVLLAVGALREQQLDKTKPNAGKPTP